jgi:hypothetical protein
MRTTPPVPATCHLPTPSSSTQTLPFPSGWTLRSWRLTASWTRRRRRRTPFASRSSSASARTHSSPCTSRWAHNHRLSSPYHGKHVAHALWWARSPPPLKPSVVPARRASPFHKPPGDTDLPPPLPKPLLQVAHEFADLHDRAGRMKAKGVIRDVVTWTRSRSYFHWRARRRIAEDQLVRSLQVREGEEREGMSVGGGDGR